MALPSGFTTVRDAVSFAIGTLIIVWTVIVRDPPADVVAVGIGTVLCGLPLAALMSSGGAKGEASKRDP